MDIDEEPALDALTTQLALLLVMQKTQKGIRRCLCVLSQTALQQGIAHCIQQLFSRHSRLASTDGVEAGLGGLANSRLCCLDFYFAFFSDLAFFCQLGADRIASVTVSNTFACKNCRACSLVMGSGSSIRLMSVHLDLFRILMRATKSFAKRAFVVPSALVAVPATVKSFSVILLPLKSCLSIYKLLCLIAQHINIIAKDGILVNHFLPQS